MHAKNLGIEVVYQDLSLINFLNVYQNLFLGRELQKRSGFSGPRPAPDGAQASGKLETLGVR